MPELNSRQRYLLVHALHILKAEGLKQCQPLHVRLILEYLCVGAVQLLRFGKFSTLRISSRTL